VKLLRADTVKLECNTWSVEESLYLNLQRVR